MARSGDNFQSQCDKVLADIGYLPNKVEKSSRTEAVKIATELRKQVKEISGGESSTKAHGVLENVRAILRIYDSNRETVSATGEANGGGTGINAADVACVAASEPDQNLEVLNALRDRSVSQYATAKQRDAWKLWRSQPFGRSSAELADALNVSRVRARDLVKKAETMSTAGVLTLVTSKNEAEAVLSNSFAANNPYRPEVFESFRAILSSIDGPTPSVTRSVTLLWDAAELSLISRLRRPNDYPAQDYSPVVTALLIMALSSWARVDVAGRIKETRNKLRQVGFADRPFIQRHLAALEAFGGNVGTQRDFLADQANRELEFAGLYHFVNGGIHPSVARHLLEGRLTVADLPKSSRKRADTLTTVAKHITKCVKVIEAYRSPMLGPMLLTWTQGWIRAGRDKPVCSENEAIKTVLLDQHRVQLNADPFCRSLYADVEAGLTR